MQKKKYILHIPIDTVRECEAEKKKRNISWFTANAYRFSCQYMIFIIAKLFQLQKSVSKQITIMMIAMSE